VETTKKRLSIFGGGGSNRQLIEFRTITGPYEAMITFQNREHVPVPLDKVRVFDPGYQSLVETMARYGIDAYNCKHIRFALDAKDYPKSYDMHVDIDGETFVVPGTMIVSVETGAAIEYYNPYTAELVEVLREKAAAKAKDRKANSRLSPSPDEVLEEPMTIDELESDLRAERALDQQIKADNAAEEADPNGDRTFYLSHYPGYRLEFVITDIP
jgi:hypothetical protein